MSNDTNRYERLFKLLAVVMKLVLDGKRDPEKLANILQAFKDGSVTASFDKVVGLLKPLTTTTLNSNPGKKTSDCFQGSRYYHCDPDINTWLPEEQPESKGGKTTCHQLEKEMTFKEMAKSILETDEDDLAKLTKMLIEGGKTHTLPEIEDMIKRQESGEDVGFETNSYANLFFVENREGGVSVVYVDRFDRSWDVDVGLFGHALQWHRECRVFFRN